MKNTVNKKVVQKKSFKYKHKDDGCVVVVCNKHGVVGRIAIGLAIVCKGCGKWIKAETEELQRETKAGVNEQANN